MNREEIKQILPHREPMLLVDEADLNEDGSATAYYRVRGDEFFLQGHFLYSPFGRHQDTQVLSPLSPLS